MPTFGEVAERLLRGGGFQTRLVSHDPLRDLAALRSRAEAA
jgi:hypothetical protein